MTSKAYHRALSVAHFKERFLKVLAVVFAFWLWFYVQNSKKEEFLKEFQVQYKFSEGHTYANEIPFHVQVKLLGPKAFLRTIQSKKFSPLIIDVTNAPIGISQIDFSPEDVTVPSGVRVLEVLPRAIPLQLEREVEKEVEILMETIGAPPEGYMIDSLTINGDSRPRVKIKGPESLLLKLQSIRSKPILLSSLKDSGTIPVELETSKLIGLKILENISGVQYQLSPIVGNFKLRNIPIENRSDYKASLQVNEVNLIVKTTAERLQELRAKGKNSGVKAFIRGERKTKGKFLEKIGVELPSGVTLIRAIPETVSVLLY